MTQVAAFAPVKPSPANCHLAGGLDRASGPQEQETSPRSNLPGENTHRFQQEWHLPPDSGMGKTEPSLTSILLSSCYQRAAFQGR